MNDNPTSYYTAPPPQGQPFAPDPSPQPKRKMSKGKKWGVGIGAVLAIGLIGSLGTRGTTGDPAAGPSPAVATSTTPTGNAAPTVEPSVQASLDKAAADKAAADKAAADKAAADKAAADAAAKKAAAEKAAADAAAKKAAAAMLDKSTYTKLTSRQFAKVAKDPDSYVGKKYVLYGYVTQFDAATGTEAFRANLGPVRKSDWYQYDTNSIVDQGRPGLFDNVVQDDLVTLYVQVQGSFSYDTQIGGSTTVPRFTAYIVKVTGSTS